jgi:inosine-uridine nucleoside N-ribohydrolase
MSKIVKLIIETDLGNDIDDALAMVLANNLSHEGYCDIIAVSINKDNSYAPIFADIINTFYEHPNISIGVVKDGFTKGDGDFIKQVSIKKEQGSYLYHRKQNQENYLDSVLLLRQVLSEAEDNSVVIVSIGLLTNLFKLLKSGPDKFSDKTGRQLIIEKVKFVSMMAGDFRPIVLQNPQKEYAEWNIIKDVNSAKYVLENWPGKIVFNGKEIGWQILFPASVIMNCFGWSKSNPVVDAYKLFKPMPYDRPCFDLVAVLEAVFPGKYFESSENGIAKVEPSGVVSFVPDEKGKHHYLKLSDDKIGEIKDLFIDTCIKAPRKIVKK